jgi:hypothetical protein
MTNVFWDVDPCSLRDTRRFRDVYCLHHQDDDSLAAAASDAVAEMIRLGRDVAGNFEHGSCESGSALQFREKRTRRGNISSALL